MLEKILNKKNVQSLSCVKNGNDVKYANVNAITRQGTNTKNVDITKHKANTQAHPDATLQRNTFQDASQIFEELSQDDIRMGNNHKTLKE